MAERNGGSNYRQVGLPTALKDGHGCKASRSHRHIGKLVGGTVRMDSEELWTGGIYTPEDECSADMSLISLRMDSASLTARRRKQEEPK